MGALGLMAGGQGTNNNFTFGNERYQYYETLCGGAGATEDGAGSKCSAYAHDQLRLTDPEILEQRYPVVLDVFHVRQLSGGRGDHAGGNGVERHIRFLEPMTANIISGHRSVPTFALNGAGEGKTGLNFVLRHAWPDRLAGRLRRDGRSGGRYLCIHTPGGGGWNSQSSS